MTRLEQRRTAVREGVGVLIGVSATMFGLAAFYVLFFWWIWDDEPMWLFIIASLAIDRITGSILDAGCGTGENALFFAGRGHKVTGIDFLGELINRAKQKATQRGLTATFLVMDALPQRAARSLRRGDRQRIVRPRR